MHDTLELTPELNELKMEKRRFLCPSCNKHTILWLLPTTEIKDLPVKCKRCGKESIVSIKPIDKA